MRELEAAAHSPVCLYKDSNPRNFLITTGTTEYVLVDFDVLTLARLDTTRPKLIVTLAMTHGQLPAQVQTALATYNTALTDDSTDLERAVRSTDSNADCLLI